MRQPQFDQPAPARTTFFYNSSWSSIRQVDTTHFVCIDCPPFAEPLCVRVPSMWSSLHLTEIASHYSIVMDLLFIIALVAFIVLLTCMCCRSKRTKPMFSGKVTTITLCVCMRPMQTNLLPLYRRLLRHCLAKKIVRTIRMIWRGWVNCHKSFHNCNLI